MLLLAIWEMREKLRIGVLEVDGMYKGVIFGAGGERASEAKDDARRVIAYARESPTIVDWLSIPYTDSLSARQIAMQVFGDSSTASPLWPWSITLPQSCGVHVCRRCQPLARKSARSERPVVELAARKNDVDGRFTRNTSR